MKSPAENLSIASLLSLMEIQEPEAIHVNHVVIEDGEWNPPAWVSLEQIPSFTVSFAGFVEVEIYMDAKHERVAHLCVRQAAMNFEDLNANGEVLPNLTVDCNVLKPTERNKLDSIAKRYIANAKLTDKSRGEALISQYVEKAMFNSRKYGVTSNA